MKAIAKVSVVEQVEEEIKKYILNDSVKIGDKLPSEKVFCEELNIGRGSVREALRLLQAKGYVEIIQGRGSFVAAKEESKSEELASWFRENEIELQKYMEVRMAIEPLAVRLAVERSREKLLQNLQSIIDRTLKAAEAKDSAELAVCDEKFHTAIVECTENQLLSVINKEIIKRLRNFRDKTFRIDGNIRNLIPFHLAIFEAIQKGDAEEAQGKLLEHLECVKKDLETSKDSSVYSE